MRCLLTLAAVALSVSLARAETCSLPGLEAASGARLAQPAAGPMSNGYGTRIHPLLGIRKHHAGFDYAGTTGDPVRAARAGVVVLAGPMAELGNSVEIAHGKGYSTVYTHLSLIGVAEGQCIAAGDSIGAVGCSGLCATPHLHFEIRQNGQPLDPSPYMPPSASAPAPAIPSLGDWTSVDPLRLLEAVQQTTLEHFLDKQLPSRIGWTERVAEARSKINRATSAQDAVAIINELLALLQTSHTALFTPDDPEFHILLDVMRPSLPVPTDIQAQLTYEQKPSLPGIGVFTRQIDGRHFIDGILEGSAAATAGLHYGDEIVSVDGAPYKPVASFRGKVGKSVTLTVRRRAGAQPDAIEVQVGAINPIAAFAEATRKSARVIEANGKRVGYIHVWSCMTEEAFRHALRRIAPELTPRPRMAAFPQEIQRPDGTTAIITEMVRLPDANASPLDYLVVDMRGKIGGNISVAHAYLAELDRPSQVYWGRHRTLDQASWHSINRAELPSTAAPAAVGPLPRAEPYRGRTALLIDHHTRSAGEIMAHGFKHSGFGLLVGTPTAGAVSSGSTYLMPGGLLLYLAVTGHSYDGRPLEGVGVHPDVRVEHPLAYAGGADPVLEAALKRLTEGQAR